MTRRILVCVVFSTGVLAGFWPVFAISASEEGNLASSERVSGVTTNPLSETEIDIVVRFADKRQKFPSPSNSEIKAAAEVILRHSCAQTNVIELLGKPSSVSRVDNQDASPARWAYDIGDSQRIEILFDTQGRVEGIVGIGVGFGKLK